MTDLGASVQTFRVYDMVGAQLYSRTENKSYASITSGQTLYMFALGHSSQAEGMKCKTKGRVYSLKIYENGSLVRSYIPVIADNGGPYLYDKVTQTFHQGVTSGLWDVGEIEGRISLGTSIILR